MLVAEKYFTLLAERSVADTMGMLDPHWPWHQLSRNQFSGTREGIELDQFGAVMFRVADDAQSGDLHFITVT
ncbi:hypothetical protein CFREI_09895 [Corynebacterium freiburgense]|nr:hypothetical protein CFREI_09895 [Corynebacterium freiburgense]